MMLALIMLALVDTLVSMKLRDEHFSAFGRHFAGCAAPNQLAAGFGFLATGRNSRSTLVPSESSSAIAKVQAEPPIEAFMPPYLGRAI